MVEKEHIERISPEAAKADMEKNQALMVCAYDDAEKCRKMLIKGAVLKSRLEENLDGLPKGKEIIFYCN
jgi:hypothetical protein